MVFYKSQLALIFGIVSTVAGLNPDLCHADEFFAQRFLDDLSRSEIALPSSKSAMIREKLTKVDEYCLANPALRRPEACQFVGPYKTA